MCGSVAYVAHGAPDRAAAVKALGARLRHRGPDVAGSHVWPHAAVAHRRLSIIDVAGGKQPLLGGDGAVAVVFNGEIYSHRALRAGLEGRHRFRTRSDSKALLHLYKERGPARRTVGRWRAAGATGG